MKGESPLPFSVRSRSGFRHAFTLLEIIVSLAIVSIIVTLFAVRFTEESVGEDLRESAFALRKMARAANRQSAAFREEHRITFFPDSFFLSRAPIADRHSADEFAADGFVVREEAPVNLQVRRFGNPKWVRPNGDVWLFQAAGLSEPISVRFSNEDGFLELTFNPMTATVDEERFLFE